MLDVIGFLPSPSGLLSARLLPVCAFVLLLVPFIDKAYLRAAEETSQGSGYSVLAGQDIYRTVETSAYGAVEQPLVA